MFLDDGSEMFICFWCDDTDSPALVLVNHWLCLFLLKMNTDRLVCNHYIKLNGLLMTLQPKPNTPKNKLFPPWTHPISLCKIYFLLPWHSQWCWSVKHRSKSDVPFFSQQFRNEVKEHSTQQTQWALTFWTPQKRIKRLKEDTKRSERKKGTSSQWHKN